MASSKIRRVAILAIVALAGLALALGRTRPVQAYLGWTVYLPTVFNTSPASTGHAKPPTDASFYITTTNPNVAYNLGCRQGIADASHSPPVNSLVVLDFGGQRDGGSGTLLIYGIDISNAQIEAVAEAFSHGYWYCTGNNDLTSVLSLVIGTNNSYEDVSASGGATWAQVVSAVVWDNQVNGYSSQVIAEGGNDIEPAWAYVGSSEAWLNGYAANAPAFLVNYGSADGCPTDRFANAYCDNGWTQDDVWYVSWGAGPARALPEIYGSANAAQWEMIALDGTEFHGSAGKIFFSGPLDTYPLWSTSNTADEAWNQLWSALNGNWATSQTLPYSVEIESET